MNLRTIGRGLVALGRNLMFWRSERFDLEQAEAGKRELIRQMEVRGLLGGDDAERGAWDVESFDREFNEATEQAIAHARLRKAALAALALLLLPSLALAAGSLSCR